MKTNLLSLKRKHPKLFRFLYHDEWLHRYVRRVGEKALKELGREKDKAWEEHDRDKYDLLTMIDDMYQTLIDGL